MSIRRARLLHPLLRLCALAVLVLGVLVAPVACALGDVHALAHGQAHVDDAAAHRGDGDGDGSGERDGASLMHALMHSGYCHGQSPALLPSLLWQGMPAATQPRPVAAHQHYRSHLLETPLRPPIAA